MCWKTWKHDDVIKWKHFPRYWPFVRGIHRSPVNSPHKSQWRGALMFTLICARINGWVNNREAGDLRRYRAHYDVIVMELYFMIFHAVDSVQMLSSTCYIYWEHIGALCLSNMFYLRNYLITHYALTRYNGIDCILSYGITLSHIQHYYDHSLEVNISCDGNRLRLWMQMSNSNLSCLY